MLDNYHRATLEGKIIIGILLVFSMFAWSVMASKALQMRRAQRLNRLFQEEYRRQKCVAEIHERRVRVEGCPLFAVYEDGCHELTQHFRAADPVGGPDGREVSLKAMELVKGALERSVAREALRLESGLILLAIAVSGAPFLGLLGTVWGVMDAFGGAVGGGHATLQMMAPGVAGALITTVAGLMVAIPSMFGYNWLVHTLRVLTVEMDNFAQELAARMEVEFLEERRQVERFNA